MKPYYETEKLCTCGCGEVVPASIYSRKSEGRIKGMPMSFINGHNNRNKQFSALHKQKLSVGMKKAWLKRTPLPVTYEEKLCPICKKTFFVPLTKKETLFCSTGCFKEHCSISRAGENNPMYGTCGELSPNWMGGISFEPYPVVFNANYKNRIREKDNNVCQVCEKTEKENGKKLDVHHIDYNKENIKKDNLISLCKKCHVKTNFNRECWINYFKRRLVFA